MTKIIVSYDGTANEADAIAYGSLLARAGAEVSLGYVRHTNEAVSDAEAQEVLDRGAALFDGTFASSHAVTDRSTPQGLSALAEQIGAQVVVFCSDSHTARGHVTIGNSAQQLLEGGPVAMAGSQTCSGSSRSARPVVTAARRRPPSPWPGRSARRSCQSSTSRRTCW
jgi:nucleotide-binding universal stress UspA family protein